MPEIAIAPSRTRKIGCCSGLTIDGPLVVVPPLLGDRRGHGGTLTLLVVGKPVDPVPLPRCHAVALVDGLDQLLPVPGPLGDRLGSTGRTLGRVTVGGQ